MQTEYTNVIAKYINLKDSPPPYVTSAVAELNRSFASASVASLEDKEQDVVTEGAVNTEEPK